MVLQTCDELRSDNTDKLFSQQKKLILIHTLDFYACVDICKFSPAHSHLQIGSAAILQALQAIVASLIIRMGAFFLLVGENQAKQDLVSSASLICKEILSEL